MRTESGPRQRILLDLGYHLTITDIAEAERKDGFFGMITNIPKERMSAADVITAYKHLWVVEDAFGEIKGSLKARPVYHWSDDRIKGH